MSVRGDAPLGATNPSIKRLRRLSGRRSSRTDEGAFVVEGAVVVREALAAGVAVEAVFVDADRQDLIVEFESLAGRVPVLPVAAGVLSSVLPATSAQPVGAVAPTELARPVAALAAEAAANLRPVLVLVDVADPGNLGTLMRAAEASGAAGVVLAGSGVDPYNPKVVRATAGSLFRLPFAVAPDAAATLEALREAGIASIAAIARRGTPHLEAPLGGAVGIVVGNEAHGLDDTTVAACDSTVTITMDGRAESLNVAMAGTVLLFEALRRRLHG